MMLLLLLSLFADGERDNHPEKVRPVPPPGIEVPAADRLELEEGIAMLGRAVGYLRRDLAKQPALLELVPDVEVFHAAVKTTLVEREFHEVREIALAKDLLKQGLDRAARLRVGLPDWTTASGPSVRGYVSRIDGSVQPYGCFVPKNYVPAAARKHRVDAWFHGRHEALNPVLFLGLCSVWQEECIKNSGGPFLPEGSFALQLYGRYCTASKFAGEVDFFEALDDLRRRYPVDEDRIVVRGFSMGGAASWHLATHYAGRWAAAAPGAGFSETPEFLRVFQKETLAPAPWEEKLWHWYNATDYAANLTHCPTIAYSGEKDPQLQAADAMRRALEAEGMTLTHIIGKNMGHNYTPEGRAEVDRLVDAAVAKGRERIPAKLRFTTWTLRYNEMAWVTVDGLEQHWERAQVDAELKPDGVSATTKNVSAITFAIPTARSPFELMGKTKVTLDGQTLEAPPSQTDRSWSARFRKTDGKWAVAGDDAELRKRHDLQGPIDDAFLDRFIIVKPTGAAANPKVGAWVEQELARSIREWRRQFRGEARVVDDTALTDADIASSHLVLWGDPSGNKVLAKIADRLPVAWKDGSVAVGAKRFPAETHVPILIYPNPLNPKRYVVLNSGPTYREYDYLNNARQTPKLPDWAVVDVTTPPGTQWPGKVVAADFFDEAWRLKP